MKEERKQEKAVRGKRTRNDNGDVTRRNQDSVENRGSLFPGLAPGSHATTLVDVDFDICGLTLP